jgi:hypothetical protein
MIEMTPEATGLEVLDLRTDTAFTTRNLHGRDIGTQMVGLQRLSRALLEHPDTILQELVSAGASGIGGVNQFIELEIDRARIAVLGVCIGKSIRKVTMVVQC